MLTPFTNMPEIEARSLFSRVPSLFPFFPYLLVVQTAVIDISSSVYAMIKAKAISGRPKAPPPKLPEDMDIISFKTATILLGLLQQEEEVVEDKQRIVIVGDSKRRSDGSLA